MRILVFNLATDADDPILGFTTRWLRAIAERAELVRVITMRAGRLDVPSNVRVDSVGKELGYGEPRRALEFYRLLSRSLREDRIDACFSHMIPIFTLLAAPLVRPRRIPLVGWYCHPSVTPTLVLAHHAADRVVSSLPSTYPYRHDKLAVIGHGIDTDLFRSVSLPDGDRPLVLCVGRVSPVKNLDVLVRAAGILRDEGVRGFRVVILGAPARPSDADHRRDLEQTVRSLGLEDVVEFSGGVPIVELPAWYARATVHVNLSVTGFGDKVAWEAMSCARPCLVSNEGYRETLGPYADELLFRFRDPADLAAKLRRVLARPLEERAAMGETLRERVVQQHGLSSLVTKLFALFRELGAAR